MKLLKRKEEPMPKHQALDIDKLEQEIGEIVHEAHKTPAPEPVDYAQPHIRMTAGKRFIPLPDYIEHSEGVDPISKQTAEVIAHQHEATAKAVEEMGEDLKRFASQLEEMLTAIDVELKNVAATAQSVRDRGKAEFTRIERSAVLISQVRAACEDTRKWIDNPE